MYERLLIAHRSDCALRLLSACEGLGIESAAIYARDDWHPWIASRAHQSLCTGLSREAYESEEDILEAARLSRASGILPGWGFLSENAYFAQRCRLLGLDFIGPNTQALAHFGDKLKTLDYLCPRLGLRQRYWPLQALADARELPFPAMLKARWGGGGKGLSWVSDAQQLNALLRFHRENHSLEQYYLEEVLSPARHIELQCLGDGRGRVQVLAARDCTAQYRHQKWLEKSLPLSAETRLAELCPKVEAALGSLNYLGLGTVEFLVQAERLALLEVNPRLQVEHGVTELETGLDLVQTSIGLSLGAALPERRSLALGEAIEFRLYARSLGTIERIGWPDYVWPDYPGRGNPDYRLETGSYVGFSYRGIYDPMLARFLVRAAPSQALGKIKAWLADFQLSGLEHNLSELFAYAEASGPR